MAETTRIEWCDHTWSPWRGCQHARLPDGTEHPGCAHCYAEAMSRRAPQTFGRWGPNGTRVLAAQSSWDQVRRWNDRAARTGVRESVFPSMCDPFETWNGPLMLGGKDPVYVGLDRRAASGPHDRATLDDARRWFFNLIDETPYLDWLLLTKRPENVRRMWSWGWGTAKTADESRAYRESRGQPYRKALTGEVCEQEPCFRSNVHLLYSASDQPSLDAGIVPLLDCRDLVPTLGISAEPLLGPLRLDECAAHVLAGDVENPGYVNAFTAQAWHPATCRVPPPQRATPSGIDWLIAGGESGPHARPCDVAWIRAIRDQCRAADAPFFLKQLGTRTTQPLRHKKGGDPAEWPADLRDCRAFPSGLARSNP